MGLIAAKCSQYGCKLEIDTERQKNFCPACGTEYIQEKVTNNQITNIQNQTNVYLSSNNEVKADEDLLKLLFYSMDFDNLKQKSLKVIEIEKDNKFAKFLYSADFRIIKQTNGIKLVDFQEKPVLDYVIENPNSVGLKFIKYIFSLFLRKTSKFDVSIAYQILTNSAKKLELSNSQLESLYDDIINDSCNINDNFIETYYSGADYSEKRNREHSADFTNRELEIMADKVNENNTRIAEYIIKDAKENSLNIKNLSKLLKRYPIGNVDGNLDKRKRLIAGIIIGTFFLILIIIGALTGTTGK